MVRRGSCARRTLNPSVRTSENPVHRQSGLRELPHGQLDESLRGDQNVTASPAPARPPAPRPPWRRSEAQACVAFGKLMRVLGAPAMRGHALALGGFDQPDTSPLFEAVSGRSHNETCAGCIVSPTTPTTSLVSASRSVSSRNLAEKASKVFAASYFLR